MADDFEDEQFAAEENEKKEVIEDELENDERSDWEEGFEKGAEAAEYQEGEVAEETEEESEETLKKKKKHEEVIEEEEF